MTTPALCYCGVIASGRCASCQRAFCSSHGNQSRCGECAEREAPRCHCGTKTSHKCSRCQAYFCLKHGESLRSPNHDGTSLPVYVSVCNSCRESEQHARYESDRTVPDRFLTAMRSAGNPGAEELPVIDNRGLPGRVVRVWETNHAPGWDHHRRTRYFFGEDKGCYISDSVEVRRLIRTRSVRGLRIDESGAGGTPDVLRKAASHYGLKHF